MALPVEVNPIFEGNRYAIQRSLRFRASASAYLSRTPASASNQKTFTWSGWIKRGVIGVTSYPLSAGTASANYSGIAFASDLLYFVNQVSSSLTINVSTAAVFRDPSSWYHVVVAVDTTQASSSNGVKIWVNGVLQTLTYTTYTQNTSTQINNAIGQFMGVTNLGGLSNQLDGYLSEVNFIDGLQLTASSFGQYNEFGVWSPQKYGGSYGTNGFYLPFTNFGTSAYAAPFDGSTQYLTFPNSSNFAFGTGAFTVEGFILASSALNDQFILGGRSAIGTMHITTGGFTGVAGSLRYVGSSTFTTGSYLICDGNWHHFAITRDGSNNVNLWIDGVSRGSGTDTTNYTTTSGTWYFARNDSGVGNFLNATVSNFRIVKGTAVYTSTFTPPTSNLTAISGTALLTLQSSTIVDNSGNSVTITNNGSVATSLNYPFKNTGPGADSSGNTNNWASWNINTTSSGTTYDAMTDVPPPSTIQNVAAGNYCVLNPLPFYNGYSVLSRGNLQFTSGNSNWMRALATFSVSSGKWYWEITANNAQAQMHGILPPTAQSYYAAATNWVGYEANGYAYFTDGTKYNNNSGVAYGATYTAGDVIGVALDLDNGTLSFYKNGTSQGIAFTGLSGNFVPAVSLATTSGANTCDANFGQRPFSYTPPSGFLPLNSNNLPAPTIPNGAKVMAATTYTGNGATPNTIINSSNNTLGVTFQPDLVWAKGRSTIDAHVATDSVRGAGYAVFPNATTAQEGSGIYQLNNNGFLLNADARLNTNAATYVAWQWNAGSGASSIPTGGSITPTGASINVSAGFSIITYTGNGVGGATVPHGLGVTPGMVIVKSRSATTSWFVAHTSLAANANLLLNTTDRAYTNSEPSGFGSGVVGGLTSTTFQLVAGVVSPANVANINTSSATYVAYCWTPIAGYSSMGSYTGNGSADGPFVYCGFRPRFLLVKSSTASPTSWGIFDTSRDTYNAEYKLLIPNSSNAEDTSSASIVSNDFLSNGFKLRGTWSGFNTSGETYIYAAFAENPFKLALAR